MEDDVDDLEGLGLDTSDQDQVWNGKDQEEEEDGTAKEEKYEFEIVELSSEEKEVCS